MALIDSAPHNATAVAITDATLIAVSQKQFVFRFLKKPFSDERLIDCLDRVLKDPVPITRQS